MNPRIGTEPGKIRPVLVVQTDLMNNEHPSTIVCPITTNVFPGANILRVHLKKGMARLKQNCDIMIDQMRAIDNERLTKRVGSIPSELEDVVKENIRLVLDL